MPPKTKVAFQPVPLMDAALRRHAYEYLMRWAPPYLVQIEKSIAQGFTPEEIANHVAREGWDDTLPKKCRLAAEFIELQEDRANALD